MLIKFEEFLLLEYTAAYNFNQYNDLMLSDGDNKFLNKIISEPKHNIKETMLFKWMKSKVLSFINFIRVVNRIYELDINFNQNIEKSSDIIIIELKNLYYKFLSNDVNGFFDFKNSLLKIIRNYYE